MTDRYLFYSPANNVFYDYRDALTHLVPVVPEAGDRIGVDDAYLNREPIAALLALAGLDLDWYSNGKVWVALESAYPCFANADEAFDWMNSKHLGDCVDNRRFAFVHEPLAVEAYETASDRGCCGFFDRKIRVGGEIAMIGCNYGH